MKTQKFSGTEKGYHLADMFVNVVAVLQVEERLPAYMEAFDVVLINDQSMTVPNAVLRQILYAAETIVAADNCDVPTANQYDTTALPPSSSASIK